MSNGRLLLWGFKPPSELAQHGLGSLEKQVLDVVWRDGQVTVRDVHAALGSDIAYTTVMTTLDRLYRKGLLDRTKPARAFVYAARASREQFQEAVASDVIAGVLASQGHAPLPFLSNLVDAVGRQDRRLLDELERLIRTKRREMIDRSET